MMWLLLLCQLLILQQRAEGQTGGNVIYHSALETDPPLDPCTARQCYAVQSYPLSYDTFEAMSATDASSYCFQLGSAKLPYFEDVCEQEGLYNILYYWYLPRTWIKSTTVYDTAFTCPTLGYCPTYTEAGTSVCQNCNNNGRFICRLNSCTMCVVPANAEACLTSYFIINFTTVQLSHCVRANENAYDTGGIWFDTKCLTGYKLYINDAPYPFAEHTSFCQSDAANGGIASWNAKIECIPMYPNTTTTTTTPTPTLTTTTTTTPTTTTTSTPTTTTTTTTPTTTTTTTPTTTTTTTPTTTTTMPTTMTTTTPTTTTTTPTTTTAMPTTTTTTTPTTTTTTPTTTTAMPTTPTTTTTRPTTTTTTTLTTTTTTSIWGVPAPTPAPAPTAITALTAATAPTAATALTAATAPTATNAQPATTTVVPECIALDESTFDPISIEYIYYMDSRGSVLEGDIRASYPVGTLAQFKCRDLFTTPDTAATTSCTRNETWSPELATKCQEELSMNHVEQVVAVTMQTLGCAYLIATILFSMTMYFFFKQFNLEKTLQLMEELTLLIAHIIILTVRDYTGFADNPGDYLSCRFISITLHYLFTSHFLFLFLECLHIYSLLTNVSGKKFFSLPVNLLLGFGLPIVPVLLTNACFHQDYNHNYTCWINYNSEIYFLVQVPIVLLASYGVLLTEQAMMDIERQLPIKDARKRKWAIFSNGSTSCLMIWSLVAFGIGSFTVYARILSLNVVVLGSNVALGYIIFQAHVMVDPKTIAFVRKIGSKFCCKKTDATDEQNKTA